LARVSTEAAAFAHRRARIMVNIAARYRRPEESIVHGPQVTDFATALRPGGDGAYVDFLGDDGQARIREAYPGATCERLVAVKQRYDPTNLFRLNHNVQQTDWRVEPHSLIIGAPQADLAELPFSPLARPAGGAGRMCQSAYPGPDRLTKVPERLPRFIPRADLERLMVAIENLDNPYQRTALLLLGWSGARRGEIARLGLDCLDAYPVGHPRVRIPAGKTYTERRVPLHPQAADPLRGLIAQIGLRSSKVPLASARQ